MGVELQKASMWKRISAYLFDSIILSILVVAFGWFLSVLLGYDGYYQSMNDAYDRYQTQYGVVFDITSEEYTAMDQQQRQAYDAAYEALVADSDAIYAYNMVLNLTLLIVTLGFLLAYLALEFAVPLLFGNGQTLGKKIFSIGLVRNDGVRVNNMQLFARTLLGKFTIGTMIPVYVLVMLFFNTVGLGGTLLLGGLLLLQIILLAATRNHTAIQDLIAGTVVVDISSQQIFRSTEDLIAYTKRLHAQKAAQQPY